MPFARMLLSVLLLSSASVTLAQVGFTTQTFTETNPSSGLRAADLNHDGLADLVTGTGTVYLNQGGGTFTQGTALPAEGGIYEVELADLNGDGAPDIVACSEATSRNGNFFYLATYLNNGSGVFTATDTITVTNCSGIAIGDATGDGKPDVVIGYSNDITGTATASNTIQIYPGLGTGMLGTPITQSVDLNEPSAGGLYSNCFLTNIVGGTFADNYLSILMNTTCVEPQGYTTPGTYSTTFLGVSYGESKFTVSEQSTHIWTYLGGRTADLNDDGQLDALFFDSEFVEYPGSQLYALLNQGGGQFKTSVLSEAQSTAEGANAFYTGVATGDFNGDGIPDIATINEGSAGSGFQGTTVSILAGTGNAQFTPSQSWAPTPATSSTTTYLSGDIVSADFDGDGKPDLAAVIYPGTVAVYLNTMGTSTSCTAPTTANTNVICSPAAGASEGSPVTVTAASNITGFTLNRLYLDNVSVYQAATQSINTPIQASTGTHNLVLVSYNNQGQAFTASRTITVTSGSGSGCLPSSSGVDICSPPSGAVLSTAPDAPITLEAGALAASGNITAIRFYEDDAAIATIYNPGTTTSYQGTTTGLVTEGNHTLTVVAYTSKGAALTKTEPFSVQLTGGCLPSGNGAKICSPVPDQVVPSTLNLSIGAQVTTGTLTAVRIYVDNKAEFFTSAGPSYYEGTAQVGLTAGTHTIVLVAYSSTGAAYTASTTVTAP